MPDNLLWYLAGLVTTPLIFVTVMAIQYLRSPSFSHWECGICNYGDFREPRSQFRVSLGAQWHRTWAHPGSRGRAVVALWRGKTFNRTVAHGTGLTYLDFQRLNRQFPHPPVTVWDVLARVPLLWRVVLAVAMRHGRSLRMMKRADVTKP